MSTVRPVTICGVHVGDLTVVGKEDWIHRDREPTPLDFEKVRVKLAARAVHEILDRHPTRPDGGDEEELWPVSVVAAVSDVSEGRSYVPFRDEVLMAYVERYGLDQVIVAAGGDPSRVAEVIGRRPAD